MAVTFCDREELNLLRAWPRSALEAPDIFRQALRKSYFTQTMIEKESIGSGSHGLA